MFLIFCYLLFHFINNYIKQSKTISPYQILNLSCGSSKSCIYALFLRRSLISTHYLGRYRTKKAPRIMYLYLCCIHVYMSECSVLMFILFVGYKHCCKCFKLNKYILTFFSKMFRAKVRDKRVYDMVADNYGIL